MPAPKTRRVYHQRIGNPGVCNAGGFMAKIREDHVDP